MWTVHLLKIQFTLLYLYLDFKQLTLNQGSAFDIDLDIASRTSVVKVSVSVLQFTVNCSKFNILFHNMKIYFHLGINKVIPVVSYCIF